MSTPHNAAASGDIAKTVLMPGDPLRAKFIAETYLENPVQFNTVRNMFGYTGTYKGKKISVMGSGMGMASIGIYSYELYKFYEVENIIRIGSAGAYTDTLKLFDLVLADSAWSESTFAKAQADVDGDIQPPSAELNAEIEAAAARVNKPLTKARIHSSDVFYHEDNVDGHREFFEKLIEESEPIYNGIRGTGQLEAARKKFKDPELRAAYNTSDSVDSELDIFHLEAEPTRRLMDFCEKYHVSLVCLLLMGLRTFFQKMNGHDDVSIHTAIARRATLKEKKSGGTRIHSFPFRTIMGEDKKFLDGVYEIRDLQNEYFRHANYDPVAYFAHRGKKYPQKDGATYEPMALTYQPLTLQEKGLDKLGGIRYKTRWYPNGATTQAMYLTVMHRPEDNGLDFNFEHQVEAVSREDLEYLYYYLCRIMFKGTENPELTVGEIIRLV